MTPAKTLLDRARIGERLDGEFVFDAHQHVGAWHPFHIPRDDADDAIAVMDRIGIDAACTSGLPAVLGGDTQGGNDLVIDVTRRFQGRLFGYVAVNPNHPAGAAEEVERCSVPGMIGIKVHSYHGKPYDDAAYRPAYEIANARGWPVLAHTWGGEELAEIDTLAGEYPDAKWLLAHAGTTNVPQYCNLVRRRDNVFLDTCASACPWDLIETLVREVGTDRVLFGTDMTFLSGAQQIGKILCARLTDDDKRLILGANARRLFSLP